MEETSRRRSLETAGPPLVTPGEAAARVVVMEAADESARAGRGVSVAA